MKRGMSILMLISLLVSLIPLPVCAAESGEQLIKQEVILAYFDIWSQDGVNWHDTNGDGKPDKPGDRKTETFPYFLSEELLSQYTLTRVEVIEPPPLTQEQYEKAGGRPYLLDGTKGELPWDLFDYWCNGCLPQEPKASARLADAQRGKAEVTWSFTLHEDPSWKALDLTSGEVRRVFGLENPPYPVWTEGNQGWRWVMPAVLLWYGIPKKLPDLYVADLDPGAEETQGGETYEGIVVFGLKDTFDKPVKARLTLTHNGYPISSVNGKVVTFEPGEEKEFEFEFTGIEGEPSTLYAKIEPYDIEGDANWEDNEMEITIDPAGVDTGTSRLTFQAVSQNRKITRPENTAKWTDWVTATLKPKKPTPPRGSIVEWHITSATLTYPKKHPNFVYGNPLPPLGVKTISMNPNGHEATVEFQEDWAMDGAKIYNIITKKLMAAEPKYYTLTANYTVWYKYKYTVRVNGKRRTRYGTGTESGTVTGRLLVNGTGVDSLSQ